jgi:hypothetical protein
LKWLTRASRVGRRQDVEALGPGRLAALRRRADQAAPAGQGVDRRRQHPGDRADPPVQRQLAEGGVAGQFVARQHTHGRQQGQRDRQVEVAAFLLQVGGGEVHGDALQRQRQAEGGQRRAHPLAALAHRLVGQPDDGEGRHAAAHLHLDVDVEHLDPGEGDCGDAGDHGGSAALSISLVVGREGAGPREGNLR